MLQLTQLGLLILFSFLFSWEPVQNVLTKCSRTVAISHLYVEFAVDCLSMYIDKFLQPLINYSISKSGDQIIFKKVKPGPYIAGYKGEKERSILTKVYVRDSTGTFTSRIRSEVTESFVEDDLPLRTEDIPDTITIKPFWHDWSWQGTVERLSATIMVIKTSSRKRTVKTKSFYDSVKAS